MCVGGRGGADVGRGARGGGGMRKKRTIKPTSSGVPGSTLHADCAMLDSDQCLLSKTYCNEAERRRKIS